MNQQSSKNTKPYSHALLAIVFSFFLILTGVISYDFFIKGVPLEDRSGMIFIAGVIFFFGVLIPTFMMLAHTEFEFDENRIICRSRFKHRCKTYEMKDLQGWFVQNWQGLRLHVEFTNKRLMFESSSIVNFEELLQFLITHFSDKQIEA